MQQLQEDMGRIRDQFMRERVGTWPQIGAGAVPPFEWSADELVMEDGQVYPVRLNLPVIHAPAGWAVPVQTFGTAIQEEFERFRRGSRGRS